jgi:hypothetical protein
MVDLDLEWVERVPPSQSSQFCVSPTHSCLILATNLGRREQLGYSRTPYWFFVFVFVSVACICIGVASKIANAPNRGGSNLIPYEIQLQRLRPGCRPAIPMVQIEIPVLQGKSNVLRLSTSYTRCARYLLVGWLTPFTPPSLMRCPGRRSYGVFCPPPPSLLETPLFDESCIRVGKHTCRRQVLGASEFGHRRSDLPCIH